MNKHPKDIGTLALFISAGAVIAASCLYIFLYQRTSTLTDQAILAKGIVAAEEADKAQGKDILSLYQDTAADRAKLAGYFVPGSDAVAFINAVEGVGNESGATVSISSIDAGGSGGSAASVKGSISASVDVGGSWPEVMRSLALFEALPYGISIDKASMDASPSGKARKGPVWRLSLDIEAAVMNSASSTTS